MAKVDKAALAERFKEIHTDPLCTAEAWIIAQILTALDHPKLALLIHDLRARVMYEVQLQIEQKRMSGEWKFKTQKNHNRRYASAWKQIDITPEVSIDPAIIGCTVTPSLARQLKRAIKEQIWLLRRYE